MADLIPSKQHLAVLALDCNMGKAGDLVFLSGSNFIVDNSNKVFITKVEEEGRSGWVSNDDVFILGGDSVNFFIAPGSSFWVAVSIKILRDFFLKNKEDDNEFKYFFNPVIDGFFDSKPFAFPNKGVLVHMLKVRGFDVSEFKIIEL